MTKKASDEWNDGPGNESYAGRWSRCVARRFLPWLAVQNGSDWLDCGCGTGALSQTILADGSPRLVVGCDRSPGNVAFARAQTSDERVEFVVAELPHLNSIPDGFDAVVAGLVLNLLPSPTEGVRAMAVRARRGGTVGAYVWDYAEGMELMRIFWDTAIALDSAARELDEAVRFPLCQPDSLCAHFRGAGLQEVEILSIVVPTVLRNFDDYWTPFVTGQGPVPRYVKSLPTRRRSELRTQLRERLAASPDGTIRLNARAWAAKGIAA